MKLGDGYGVTGMGYPLSGIIAVEGIEGPEIGRQRTDQAFGDGKMNGDAGNLTFDI